MRFFAICQHISGISDLRQIFGKFGHTIDDMCLSGHAYVLGRARDSVPMLDGDNWCNIANQNRWNEFFDKYEKVLSQYDGFICFYPPIFARLYKRFNKPVIIQIPIRYEYGADSSVKLWDDWNDFLKNGIDNRRIFITANSVYDKKYTELFINRHVEHIPNLCEYSNIEYRPKGRNYLYYSSVKMPYLSRSFLYKYDALKAGYSWGSVGEFRGIVHFPYNVSTMSIFEQYTANIPLFFPTKHFLMDMYKNECPVLDQICWNKTYNKPTGSLIKPYFYYDPNDYKNLGAVNYWIQFADYYDVNWMPHITYFSSIKELIDMSKKMKIADLRAISEKMRAANLERKRGVYSKWESILSQIKYASN